MITTNYGAYGTVITDYCFDKNKTINCDCGCLYTFNLILDGIDLFVTRHCSNCHTTLPKVSANDIVLLLRNASNCFNFETYQDNTLLQLTKMCSDTDTYKVICSYM